jgi:predicted O-linked N-acetylglucosamine transferase (SPINDLY family)
MLDEAQRARIGEAKALAVSGAEMKALSIIKEMRASWFASAEVECEIGQIFELVGFRTGAIDAYQRSIALDENYVLSYEKLGTFYSNLDYPGRACWCARRAAELRKFDARSLGNLARALYSSGNVNSSLRTYRRALKMQRDPAVHSSYLFTLLHDPRQTPVTLKRTHENWIETHFPEAPIAPDFDNSPDPERKLRIGYVSSEFKSSPDVHFILPVIRGHKRSAFDVFCYHLSPASDEFTELYRSAAAFWRDASCLSPAQIREQILRDEIDVLVEPSGHLGRSGVGVFQMRAAPVQAAYLDYPCTTGCTEMDYFVTDHRLTPDRSFARNYSERRAYFMNGGHLLYKPLKRALAGAKLPAYRNGCITFGLFQRAPKYSPGLWDAIGRIMRAVPGSRLLVYHANNELEEADGEVRNGVLCELAARRVSGKRVQFLGTQTDEDRQKAIASVDIALDTFPFNGVTTTCECLCMGVPVVTFAGAVHASRIGVSILSRVGLEDWVAASLEEYVNIATRKAADLQALAKLRSGLRRRMPESSLCDQERVVSELEEGYRWMWRQWCGSQVSRCTK